MQYPKKVKVEWEEKVWGRVKHIFSLDKSAVSYLEVKERFRCSRHFHRERVNSFAVISGKIIVEMWSIPNKYLLQVFLGPGEICTVPTFVDHRFSVLESGIVIEHYSPDEEQHKVRIDDIARKDVGGEIPEIEFSSLKMWVRWL